MLSGQRHAIEDTGGPLKSGRPYLGWPWTTEYLSGLHQMIRWPWNRPGYQIRPDRRNLDPGRLDSTSPASSSGYYFAKRCLRRRISKIGKQLQVSGKSVVWATLLVDGLTDRQRPISVGRNDYRTSNQETWIRWQGPDLEHVSASRRTWRCAGLTDHSFLHDQG
jgi:hypothetical protein